jgi:hypothetical protein
MSSMSTKDWKAPALHTLVLTGLMPKITRDAIQRLLIDIGIRKSIQAQVRDLFPELPSFLAFKKDYDCCGYAQVRLKHGATAVHIAHFTCMYIYIYTHTHTYIHT